MGRQEYIRNTGAKTACHHFNVRRYRGNLAKAFVKALEWICREMERVLTMMIYVYFLISGKYAQRKVEFLHGWRIGSRKNKKTDVRLVYVLLRMTKGRSECAMWYAGCAFFVINSKADYCLSGFSDGRGLWVISCLSTAGANLSWNSVAAVAIWPDSAKIRRVKSRKKKLN